MHDGAFARRQREAASLAQFQEDRIEQRILELLRDHDTFETGKAETSSAIRSCCNDSNLQ